ncbi:hypothetical protein SS7213T_02568 [Staphylococcus simiae CCM 7213 = CCUG 51256]|uniref:Uncharacterized protein n=1 Tax=Staphylococcus simiae CCM 7213 = CCUG 51256 TaxID=911238 RepID=G5JGE7_9STAP|nr:hypothetical protein SS7213T_02568 [Staphylococcus simiae CCM 7213 = CCUG 51256]
MKITSGFVSATLSKLTSFKGDKHNTRVNKEKVRKFH